MVAVTLAGGGRRKCSIKSRQQKPATTVKGRRRCGEGRGGGFGGGNDGGV